MNSKSLGNLSDHDLLAALRDVNVRTSGIQASVYGLTAAGTAAFGTSLDDYESLLDAYGSAQLAEDAALAAKNTARENIIAAMRAQMRLMRAQPGITAEALAAAGLDSYDSTPTAAAAPTTAPIAHVDYGKLKHTIYFRDASSEMSETKAKPKGVRGAEIWRFIGTAAPANQSDYDFVALDTGSPYVVFYDMTQSGKKAYYILRWLSTAGDVGEWSETVEATING